MTWSYNLQALGTANGAKDNVRMLIGDTVSTSPLLQDEEINFVLTRRPSVYGAASDCCRSLAARFASQATTAAGDTKIMFSDISKAYSRQAVAYDQLAIAGGAGMPYAGGISQADKANQEQDTDRVSPQFNIGMDDNFMPIAPVGNETADSGGNAGSE
jgi:hypothetical protein